MKDSTRFQSAVATARPRGIRVIEAYSPKLGRRLQCFGELAFAQWICLEADPAIQTFCERPVHLDLGEGKRLADFWARSNDSETLLLVDDTCQASTVVIDGIALPVRAIPPAELAAAQRWIANWTRMLPVMTSCRQLIPPSLLQSLLKFIGEPMPLSRIEQEFVTSDPTLVRAAVFSLLHQGQLRAPQLHTDLLSFSTCFQPMSAPS